MSAGGGWTRFKWNGSKYVAAGGIPSRDLPVELAEKYWPSSWEKE